MTSSKPCVVLLCGCNQAKVLLYNIVTSHALHCAAARDCGTCSIHALTHTPMSIAVRLVVPEVHKASEVGKRDSDAYFMRNREMTTLCLCHE